MFRHGVISVFFVVSGFAAWHPPLWAQGNDPFEGVGIDEQLGDTIPMDVSFLNHSGDSVRLGELFSEGKPIVLSLIYFRCPMLCNLILDGKTETMRNVDFLPGQEYKAVTVSFSDIETPGMAMQARNRYLELLGRPGAEEGWEFLVGSEASIRALTDAVGFHFRWDEPSQDYAHGATLIFISPEGVVTRYLYGITYSPRDFRIALIEASEGRIGTTLDRLLMYCLQYDPSSRSFVPNAFRIMKLGGLLTLLVVGSVLFVLWRRERRRYQDSPGEPA